MTQASTVVLNGATEHHGSAVISAPSDMTPMQMLSVAIQRGADLSVMEKLMDLQERHSANQARRAFDAAMADAKAGIKPIAKDQTVSYGAKEKATSYQHETLAAIARVVDPVLAQHGLSYRYRVSSGVNQPITVTCIVAHRDGHCEETTLVAGADSSGSKNSIQAIGSTITYLQRYTLKAALGLAAAHDDDGKSADQTASDVVSDEQADILRALITETGTNLEKFLEVAKAESVSDVLAKEFPRLKAMLEAKKAKMAEKGE